MSLQNYPFDVQNCTIGFESYAFQKRDIKYFWKPKTRFKYYGRKLPDINIAGVRFTTPSKKISRKSRLNLELHFGKRRSSENFFLT